MDISQLLMLAAAPLAMVLVAGCLREPMRVALPVYAALIPFGGLLTLGDSKFLSVSSLLGLLLGAGLLLQVLRTRPVTVGLSPTVGVWLLLLGVALSTVLWSISPRTTVSSVLVLGSLVMIYVLVAFQPVDRQVLTWIENGLLIGGLACVGYGLFQLVVQGGFPADPPVPGVTDGRFGNDLLGPNNQAVAFILPLMVSLTRAVSLPSRSSRLAYNGASGVLLLGILMTGSRGGILSTIVAVVVLAAVVPRGRGLLVPYGLAGATVAAVVFFAHPFGLAERTVETTSSSGRTDIWEVALAACPRYCGIGSGWGTFRDVYAETQASVPSARVLVGAGGYEPHDVWLLVIIEMGIAGLILLLIGLCLSGMEAWRLPPAVRGAPLGALAATVFGAFFLSNLEFKFFWMALMMVALSRNLLDEEQRAFVAGSPVRAFPRVAGAVSARMAAARRTGLMPAALAPARPVTSVPIEEPAVEEYPTAWRKGEQPPPRRRPDEQPPDGRRPAEEPPAEEPPAEEPPAGPYAEEPAAGEREADEPVVEHPSAPWLGEEEPAVWWRGGPDPEPAPAGRSRRPLVLIASVLVVALSASGTIALVSMLGSDSTELPDPAVGPEFGPVLPSVPQPRFGPLPDTLTDTQITADRELVVTQWVSPPGDADQLTIKIDGAGPGEFAREGDVLARDLQASVDGEVVDGVDALTADATQRLDLGEPAESVRLDYVVDGAVALTAGSASRRAIVDLSVVQVVGTTGGVVGASTSEPGGVLSMACGARTATLRSCGKMRTDGGWEVRLPASPGDIDVVAVVDLPTS